MGCVLRAYTTLHNSSQQVMTGTSDLLTTSWTAVQQLVEELRDPILKLYTATEPEEAERKVDLIKRLQVLALKCQLASEASRALQKGGQANLQHARGNTPQRSTSLGQEKLRTVGSGSKKDLQPAAQSTYVHQEPSSQSKQHLAQQRDQLFLESKAADDRVPSGTSVEQQARRESSPALHSCQLQPSLQPQQSEPNSHHQQTHTQPESTGTLPIGVVDLSSHVTPGITVSTATLVDAHAQTQPMLTHQPVTIQANPANSQADVDEGGPSAAGHQMPTQQPNAHHASQPFSQQKMDPQQRSALTAADPQHSMPAKYVHHNEQAQAQYTEQAQAQYTEQAQHMPKAAGQKRNAVFHESELPSAKEAARWLHDTAKSPLDAPQDANGSEGRGKAMIRFAMSTPADTLPP